MRAKIEQAVREFILLSLRRDEGKQMLFRVAAANHAYAETGWDPEAVLWSPPDEEHFSVMCDGASPGDVRQIVDAEVDAIVKLIEERGAQQS